MKFKRLIARLDCKNESLVKGIHLEGLRVLGAPKDFLNLYYQQGIDELIYMDVVASLYNRNGIHELVSEAAENIGVPITVGGGVRSAKDVKSLLERGADKILLNTAVVNDPSLLARLVDQFGSSTISVAVEAIKISEGNYGVFTDNGREDSGISVVAWLAKIEELGAGEVVLTSVDHEGTGRGLDMDLLSLADGMKIPVIAHGGVGRYEHIRDGFSSSKCDGIAVASVFHYGAIDRDSEVKVSGNTHFLKSIGQKSDLMPLSVQECKTRLRADGVNTR